MQVQTIRPTLAEIEEVYKWAGQQLRAGGLSRRDLSTIESELVLVGEGLELEAREAIARGGDCGETRLIDTALRAIHESLDWLRLYRRHATLVERQDQLLRIHEAAMGAIELLHGRVHA